MLLAYVAWGHFKISICGLRFQFSGGITANLLQISPEPGGGDWIAGDFSLQPGVQTGPTPRAGGGGWRGPGAAAHGAGASALPAVPRGVA